MQSGMIGKRATFGGGLDPNAVREALRQAAPDLMRALEVAGAHNAASGGEWEKTFSMIWLSNAIRSEIARLYPDIGAIDSFELGVTISEDQENLAKSSQNL